MTSPRQNSPQDSRHAWERLQIVWDLYTTVVIAATIVLVVVAAPAGAARWWAAGLLAAILPLYFLVAREPIRTEAEGTLRGYVYITLMLALYGTASFLVNGSWFAAFAFVPHCFQLLPLRRAVVAVVAVNLVPLLAVILDQRDSPDVAGLVATGALTTTFALFIGFWIERIIVQSRERADLIARLEASRAEVARLSHAAGVAAERDRLAAEIHDTLAQGFLGILMLLQAAERRLDPGDPLREAVFQPSIRVARENLAEARALIAARPPVALATEPVAAAIDRLTTTFGAETGIAASYEVEGTPRTLAPDVDVVLLRAAQEALTNVRKHAAAGSVSVRLAYEDAVVRLTVADDGGGFAPGTAAEPDAGSGEHFGLVALHRRAARLDGTATVDGSGARGGTTVTVELPAQTS
ncbi:sensor histidine kinase [Spirillospora sp. NPDC047279]|uniref:sensor histidine kinase n=1 Tax=Spirillospora sp. NPDC047279 TaxID=3155478 RepID=UPI0033D0844E